MFNEIEPGRSEQLAARTADGVASLWFPIVLGAAITAGVILNVIAQPFEPYTMIMIAGLAVGLSTIAACHGPLILLAQRHAAARDRARDIETYIVSSNSERDLHDLKKQLAALERRLIT